MNETPTIGFVGTGVIASALVRGLCRAGAPYPIIVSPRNREHAAALAQEFPTQVRVAASNQQVLDEAQWLLLAVVPAQGEQILRALRFRPAHKIINLLSDKSLPQIAAWTAPAQVLAHMVPLPFVAQHLGPIAIYPPHPEVQQMFAVLGQIIAVDNARDIHVLGAITALMAPFYTLLAQIVAWGGGYGLEEATVQAYSSGFFAALAQLAAQATPEALRRLADEMTPGGLNDMAKTYLSQHNAFALWTQALEPVMQRLEPSASATPDKEE